MAEQEWRTRLIAVATDSEGHAVPVAVGLAADAARFNTIVMQVDDGRPMWFQPEAASEHIANVRHVIAEKQRNDGAT